MRKLRWTIGSGRPDRLEHQAFLDATLPHLDAVYRLARQLAGDAWDTDDLVQETYLRAYAKFDQHRGDSTRAWLAAICLNTARSDARRRRRRPDELLGADPEALVAATDDVAASALAALDRRDIARALAQLPEEQRICILLMDVAGYTASEVAQIRGCGRGTVLSRVHRGRRRLAGLLAALRTDEEASRGPA